MSPSLLDKPRFANGNLSVFRQSAADDSDGNASVSSSGSHKRRRRPKQTGGEKKLPGSALSTAHQLTRRNSQGSDFGIPDYYDGDSSDENLDVRTGLQSLNLQKSAKTAGMHLPSIHDFWRSGFCFAPFFLKANVNLNFGTP